jgi:hypothetical protein
VGLLTLLLPLHNSCRVVDRLSRRARLAKLARLTKLARLATTIASLTSLAGRYYLPLPLVRLVEVSSREALEAYLITRR